MDNSIQLKNLRLTKNQWMHTSQMMKRFHVPHNHLEEIDIRKLYFRLKKLQWNKDFDEVFRQRAARAIYRRLCASVGIAVNKYKLPHQIVEGVQEQIREEKKAID